MTDQGMMELLRQIADSLTEMVKWEYDITDKYTDGFLPMLDLKVKIDKDDPMEPVKFMFYQKPMASRNLVSAMSAMPSRLVFTTLVEEGMRRLRNTSPSLIPTEKAALMKEFNLWMMQSGHTQEFRLNVTRKVMLKYKEARKTEDEGGRRLYR